MAASRRDVVMQTIVVPSHKTFEETRKALESAVPELDMASYKTKVEGGDLEGAFFALNALPPVNIFSIKPRNLGPMMPFLGQHRKSIQYELGHPLLHMHMAKENVGVGLYLPVRVILYEDLASGKASFEYNLPSSTTAEFNNEALNSLARDLDAAISKALEPSAS